MQYLLMIYEAESIWDARSEEEQRQVLDGYYAFSATLDADKVTWSGEPLMPTATAVSLRVAGGQAQTTDGPFAETKEQLGGYYLLDVPDLETALKYAAMIPTAQTGCIEVRPIADYSGLTD